MKRKNKPQKVKIEHGGGKENHDSNLQFNDLDKNDNTKAKELISPDKCTPVKNESQDFHTEDNPQDFTGGRIMRREPGKPKLFRCRQCDFVAQEKEEYWKHARSHIKDDKCLQCPKCPFVTEYKHHLEYHLRNHFGSKPFKCNKCNYACVNKSMLNSHMKSHTNVYQYRCADCTYATKYCHSLKLHLQKYNHKPAMVLNSDGSLPNDGLGDFDLVSKRGPPRGPRSMKRESCSPPGLDAVGGMLGMHPAMAGPGTPLNGMQAMMAGFWANGAHPPPPLIPVSGLPPMPGMPPGHSPITPGDGPGPNSRNPHLTPPGPMGTGRGFKCQLCDFTADHPHVFMEHTIRAHGREGSEMLDMMRRREFAIQSQMSRGEIGGSGAPHEGLEAMAILAARGAIESHRRSSFGGSGGHHFPDNYARSMSPPSPLATSPPPYHDDSNHAMSPDDRHSSVNGNEEVEKSKTDSKLQNGERPLDLSNLTSSSCSPPLKRRWHDTENDEATRGDFASKSAHNEQPSSAASAHSEHEAGPGSHGSHDDSQQGSNSRPTSPTPRKRSRKGNPFKLDAISMKLQTERQNEDASTSDGAGDDSELVQPHSNRFSSHSNQSSHHSNTMHNRYSTTESHTPQQDSEPVTDKTDNSERKADNPDNTSHNERKSRDSMTSPTTSKDDQNQSLSTTSPGMYFSTNIDRRKMLDNLSRTKDSPITNGKIYTPNDIGEFGDESDLENDNGTENEANMADEKWSRFVCHHCGIAFQDCIMYSIHCGYHGYKDPFKCNSCGIQTHDKVEFFLHIARTAHS